MNGKQKTDGEEPFEVFSLMVHLAGSVSTPVVSKVLCHFPQLKSAQEGRSKILKTLFLVEPGQGIWFTIAIGINFRFVKVYGDFQLPWTHQPKSMNCPVVIKFRISHHEMSHEWKDTKEFHEIFGSIEICQIFWLLACHKFVFKKVIRFSKGILQSTHAKSEGYQFSPGLLVTTMMFQDINDSLGGIASLLGYTEFGSSLDGKSS
mmetsp:Transcript_44766/g.108145  ORF Transcript_44766/g.108145 Transcript_44766/m.108145 type:complete len:205 (+) Transcript_44766:3794-4408(+)